MSSRKDFVENLDLHEFLIECEKVSSNLRENELDVDFNSHRKEPTYIPKLPLL